MKHKLRKGIAFAVIALFVGASVVPSIVGVDGNRNSLINNKTKVVSDETSSVNEETEYWALLVAVGVYAGHPDEDRPSMLREVENLHEKLLVSECWDNDNIKLITAENATVFNIIKGLRWLDKKDDNDDFSLVYITTHGFPLRFDIPPFDEEDKHDEALVSYRGFQNPFAIIWDDLLNLLLSLLNSKGVCVVIDSCYAGGFNDPPYFNNRMKDNRVNANKWMHGFAEDLSESGRVVLMSCSEDEVSYGSIFSKCLIEALTGYGDANEDDLVSAEEAFEYVIENLNEPYMHPTIYDGYPGELQLTEVELPPSNPVTPTGQVLGDTNTTYNYSTVSTDPEGGKISYGWDWNGDFIVDEWTDPFDSNTTVNISHSWNIEGTYNLRVKAKDEGGVLSDWSNHTVVMICDDNIPDQQQINIGGCTNLYNQWVAQSFVPSLDTLSKFELVLESRWSGDPPPLQLYIRDNLSGDNLAESSRVIPKTGKYAWFTFDFKDLDVIPGKTYYIVCEEPEEFWPYYWYWLHSDCYPQGEVLMSGDGINWTVYKPSIDCCFVTWGI